MFFSNPFVASPAPTQRRQTRAARPDRIFHNRILMVAALLFSGHLHSADRGVDMAINTASPAAQEQVA